MRLFFALFCLVIVLFLFCLEGGWLEGGGVFCFRFHKIRKYHHVGRVFQLSGAAVLPNYEFVANWNSGINGGFAVRETR